MSGEEAVAAEYRWEGDRVARWLRNAEGVDRQLAPVTEALFDAAALDSGERVLDVGCGHGPTTRKAAWAVGPYGRVTGLDVSAAMIEAAEAADTSDHGATIDWTVGDVAEWTAPYPHDVVISRFGVMFFSDPHRAFSSLSGALRAGGRLCVAVWARRDASQLFELPYTVATSVLDEMGLDYEVPPADGGPFSLSDRAAVTELLEGAGFVDVGWAPHTFPMTIGGGMAPEVAAKGALELGPTRIVVPDDEAVRQAVVEAVTDAYCEHVDRDGNVVLDGSIVVVTATRP
ncbi:MAG: class I SAM-dependent methyltransferase [Acidimicrobiales bacterium]|nr:class I SAM-dependent methyltransferase [Acidimicrobiales bacterium]